MTHQQKLLRVFKDKLPHILSGLLSKGSNKELDEVSYDDAYLMIASMIIAEDVGVRMM